MAYFVDGAGFGLCEGALGIEGVCEGGRQWVVWETTWDDTCLLRRKSGLCRLIQESNCRRRDRSSRQC